MRDESPPAWVKQTRAAQVANAQRIRAQISTLDNDTLFWIEFDSSGRVAFNRILCRKVGDANSYVVEHSWQSMVVGQTLHWREVSQPYPSNEANQTMRMVEIEPDEQAALAMLAHHHAWDALRMRCEQSLHNALLCRGMAGLPGH